MFVYVEVIHKVVPTEENIINAIKMMQSIPFRKIFRIRRKEKPVAIQFTNLPNEDVLALKLDLQLRALIKLTCPDSYEYIVIQMQQHDISTISVLLFEDKKAADSHLKTAKSFLEQNNSTFTTNYGPLEYIDENGGIWFILSKKINGSLRGN